MPIIATQARALAAEGLFDEEIAERLQEQTGQEVRPSYIKKILKRSPRRGRPLELHTQIEWLERIRSASHTEQVNALLEQLLRVLTPAMPKTNQGGGCETNQGGDLDL